MIFIFYFKVFIASLITLLSASMPLSLPQHSFFGGLPSVTLKFAHHPPCQMHSSFMVVASFEGYLLFHLADVNN